MGAAGVGGTPGGGNGKAAETEAQGRGEVALSSWNWEREAGGGAGFDDFFETFAGGGVEGFGDWDEGGDGEVAEQHFAGGMAS